MSILSENPVLGKELNSRLNLQRQTKANRIAIYLAAGLVAPLLYYYSIKALVMSGSANEARDFYSLWLIGIEMSLMVLLAPALTAGAITIEREKQTWNALLLTRLRPVQIVSGKYLGALAPAFLLLAALLPINLLAAVCGAVPLATVLLSHLMLALTTLLCGAIGLLCSWACRRTQASTSAAAGSVAALVLGTYLAAGLWMAVLSSAGNHANGAPRLEEFFPLWLNPYFAMWSALDYRSVGYDSSWAAMHPAIVGVYLVFAALSTTGLLALVTRRLGNGPKEMTP